MSGDLEGESKHKAAKAKYEAEKQALLDRKWSVTIKGEMKGDKKLRPGILVKVTDENSDLFSRVGRLISQVSQQKWEILFRVDGEDIDDEHPHSYRHSVGICSLVVDIPKGFEPKEKYSATYGHKINHNFDDTVKYFFVSILFLKN